MLSSKHLAAGRSVDKFGGGTVTWVSRFDGSRRNDPAARKCRDVVPVGPTVGHCPDGTIPAP
jgi:hypothetical protein